MFSTICFDFLKIVFKNSEDFIPKNDPMHAPPIGIRLHLLAKKPQIDIALQHLKKAANCPLKTANFQPQALTRQSSRTLATV
jgi:hypothetical protein